LVEEPVALERLRERFLCEMGPAARTWITPHVRHRLDPVLGEQLEKSLERACRMPDGPYHRRRPIWVEAAGVTSITTVQSLGTTG